MMKQSGLPWLSRRLIEQECLTLPLEVEGDNYYPEYACSYLTENPERIKDLFQRRLEKIKRYIHGLSSEFVQACGDEEEQEQVQAEYAAVCSEIISRILESEKAFILCKDADCEEFGEWLRQVLDAQ